MTVQFGQFIKELERRMQSREKIRILENRKAEIIRVIQTCESYKKKITIFVEDLNRRYSQRLITYEEYSNKLSSGLKGRSIDEWIKYYDRTISNYRKQLNICNNNIKKARNKPRNIAVGITLLMFVM